MSISKSIKLLSHISIYTLFNTAAKVTCLTSFHYFNYYEGVFKRQSKQAYRARNLKGYMVCSLYFRDVIHGNHLLREVR